MNPANAQVLEECELSRAISEAEKAAYDARQAELQAAKLELELLETQINMDYSLGGVYNLHGEITEKSMNRLFRQMRIWHKHDPHGAWTISLNSVGGGLWPVAGMIDELTAQSIWGGGTHEVTIKVRGIAASAGGMLLQAADHRVIGRNAQLMIHKGGPGHVGSITVDDLADEHQWCQASVDQMIALFLSRTDKITRSELLRKITRKDWWMYADEAIELGFADRIG